MYSTPLIQRAMLGDILRHAENVQYTSDYQYCLPTIHCNNLSPLPWSSALLRACHTNNVPAKLSKCMSWRYARQCTDSYTHSQSRHYTDTGDQASHTALHHAQEKSPLHIRRRTTGPHSRFVHF